MQFISIIFFLKSYPSLPLKFSKFILFFGFLGVVLMDQSFAEETIPVFSPLLYAFLIPPPYFPPISP